MRNIGIKSFLNYINERDKKIILCKAYGRCSIVCFADKDEYTISSNLKEMEILLKNHHFFRCHHKSLINLNSILEVDHKKRIVTLESGYVAEVSVRKHTELKFLMANGERINGIDFKQKKVRRKNASPVTF